MRFYKNFPEAINEIKRDLKEMGIEIHTASVQNMNTSTNRDYDSHELQNYIYTVTSPDYTSIPLKSPEWAEKEFEERVGGRGLNPGMAWKLRFDYWKQFLRNEVFDYTYPQRMEKTVKKAVEALKKDPNTRRAFIPIFDPILDEVSNFGTRIPCSLGYWLNFRQEKLNLTYLLRSSDFSEHFNYDIYLADRLKCYIAEECGMQPGTFTHWIGSLHIFSKDVKDVF